jgi:membrane protein YqaA with SNARE-associated domain
MWLKWLAVFGLGMTGLWQGIPAGFALQLHPLVTAATAAAGSLLATLIVLFLGDKLRQRLIRRKPAADGNVPAERLIDRVWRRYGVVGLGLLGPGLTGAPLGAALGLSMGVPGRRLLSWLALGIVLWSTGMTLAGMAGTAGILKLLGRA